MKLPPRERRPSAKRQASQSPEPTSDSGGPPQPKISRTAKAASAVASTKKAFSMRTSSSSSSLPGLVTATDSESEFAFNDASSFAPSEDNMPALESMRSSQASSPAASRFSLSSDGMGMDVDDDIPQPVPVRRRRTVIEDVEDMGDGYDERRRQAESSAGPSRTAEVDNDIEEQPRSGRQGPRVPSELENIRKHLRTPIYAFFRPEMAIEYRRNKTSGKNQKHHMFTCVARGCKHRVARNLETQDRTSTKNLKDHAIRCWGKDTVTAALEMQNLDKARGLVKKHGGKKNGLLTTAFTKLKKAGARIFSHVPLTKPEVR
ncbi:hypothetical protein BDZ89DRAFT_1150792 [Hymenopellis radicata]|nr:hypothetical protein BDZ89DRAFT_1150792 [Hymenopellis radicata]